MLTADGEASRCEAIAAAGAVPALLCLVADSPAAVQVAAAAALTSLTGSLAPEIGRAACAAGAVPLLVPLLSSPQADLRQWAAAVLTNLAVDCEDCRQALAVGALATLVQLLRDRSPATSAKAAHTLAALAEDEVGRGAAIVSLGAVPQLLRMLCRGTPGQREAAAGAVRAMADDDQAAALIAAGAVGPAGVLAAPRRQWRRGVRRSLGAQHAHPVRCRVL